MKSLKGKSKSDRRCECEKKNLECEFDTISVLNSDLRLQFLELQMYLVVKNYFVTIPP